MDPTILAHVAQLSDPDLLAQVKVLTQRERDATVALIVHLAELDERRLYLAEGYPSLFKYCTDALHLSEHATYHRIEAARAVRRFPVLLGLLAEGAVHLTAVGLLAPHLTVANHEQVLALARHKSRRETEELVAWLRPQPPVPDAIRKLPTRKAPAAEMPDGLTALDDGTARSGSAGEGHISTNSTAPPVAPAPPAGPGRITARSATITPLARDRYKVVFTASAALKTKLRQAQALLRHQIPNGDLEQIFDRALTALLRDLTKQKAAATERPREQQAADSDHRSRHIPAAVKRAVWERDGGRCAFVSESGTRCTEEGFLEFHHVVPHAVGGPATDDNIELRCRAHNGYEAECDFGRRQVLRVREEGARYEREAPPRGAHARGISSTNSDRTKLPYNFPRSDLLSTSNWIHHPPERVSSPDPT
jgi:5-methylcytosine-specific restriction endonuclease McrA